MEEKIRTKKYIFRKILIVILIIFIIFLALALRNCIIFNKIEDVAEEKINANNCYSEKISINGTSITIMKSYSKDSKYITELKTFSPKNDEKRQLTIYEDENEKLAIIETDETKIAFTNGDTIIGSRTRINTFKISELSILNQLLLSATSRITTEMCNNKECYLIEITKGWKMWVDKETGLVVREINGSTLQDSYYKFNEVVDEKIVKPDISDCEIQ